MKTLNIQTQQIWLDADIIEEYNRKMDDAAVNKLNDLGVEAFGIYQFWSVDFEAGYSAELRICSGADNSPFGAEAVLFQGQEQVAFTDRDNILEGAWEFYLEEDKVFVIEIMNYSETTSPAVDRHYYRRCHQMGARTREFYVYTPLGRMKVDAKGFVDNEEDYPGIQISIESSYGTTTLVSVVEYESTVNRLQTVVWGDCNADEPTQIIGHHIKM